MMLLWTVPVVIAGVLLVWWVAKRREMDRQKLFPPGEPEQQSAEDVLRDRFARGEIDEAELERGRSALRERPST
jgi:uncharacterized membrane protein